VDNKERVKATNLAWRAANIDKMRAADSARYKANSEKRRAQSKAWATANPEACRIIKQNRNARKLGNGGNLSKGLSAKLLKLQQGRCACCGEHLGDNFHLDHIVPLVLGGANEDWNIQLLRAKCNMEKHTSDPIDFMQRKGMLL
jgi:5-methylcytosine-specific restriction endonuclease McrA